MTDARAPIGDEPAAGFYKIKIIRGGPWLGVRIWYDDDPRDPDFPDIPLDRAHIWRAERDGREVDVSAVWPFAANHPIDAAEYAYLLGDAAHARAHRPFDPEANPGEAVDLGRIKPIF